MNKIKLNISQDKFTKSYQLDQHTSSLFANKKIYDTITLTNTNIEELNGCVIKITGGSTTTGSPMYSAIPEAKYKRVWYKQNRKKGMRRKLRVYGNLITHEIVSIQAKLCQQ